MHKNFRKLLENAEGVSEFIIAVNVDIRGFSDFSKQVESADAAMYIKRVYMKLVDEYLTDSSFFKPTGDGLLLAFPYNEKNLDAVFKSTVNKCWKVINNFSKICKNDAMINFPVPQKVGIGIARGTACRIAAKRTVLDYSGHVLNLASRLMDIARPGGIVFYEYENITLLDAKGMDKFSKTKVYLKGIAEDKPIPIYYSKGLTKIPAIHKSPLNKITWKKITFQKKLSDFMSYGNYYFDLSERPTDPDEILAEASYPLIENDRKVAGLHTIYKPIIKYETKGDEYKLLVDMADIAKTAKKDDVKDAWIMNLVIKYPVRPK